MAELLLDVGFAAVAVAAILLAAELFERER
jgi:hypothetical protein